MEGGCTLCVASGAEEEPVLQQQMDQLQESEEVLHLCGRVDEETNEHSQIMKKRCWEQT